MTPTLRKFRIVAGAAIPAFAVVAFAALVLLLTPPVRAADPVCKPGEVRASWYGRESGSRAATGLHFDGSQMIVAHKTLKFGTKVRFTYRGRSIIAPVLDRGPYIRGRTYDLSAAVARALGTKGAGVVCVVAKVLR